MALRPHVTPELLNKVTKALGITALDQWYHVSHHAITKAIGPRTLNNFGGISEFLNTAYPHHQFDEEKLASRKNIEKDQKFVEVIIRKLFPNTEIHTKARKAVGIINPETDAYLEIDFWIPSLNLGIEFQDKHHYEYRWYANGSLEEYQKRDDLKKDAMSKLGYTLITIGYWWDKTLESLAATIRKFRPDLLREYDDITTEPISAEPPSSRNTPHFVIPGVDGIMSPFIPTYNFDPTNWFAGEKYDGVRGVFHPTLNKMFSRMGNELSVLSSLLNDIPRMLVEGEITAGRGNYNKVSVVSHHTNYDKVNWPMFRFVLFDIPDSEFGNYTKRYSAVISGLLDRPFVFAQSVFRVLLGDKSHLKMLMDSIINDAGEGIIAQKDTSYEYGRATGLAKIKVRRDADAQVLSVNKNSFTCKLVNGVTAEIACSDNFDSTNVKVGDIVSYYYSGYTQSSLPKQAEIYRVRYDLTWDKIISDEAGYAKRRSIDDTIGGRSLLSRNTAKFKMGHWNKPRNVRKFFDEFARRQGFDPLVPENWYPIRYRALRNAGGASMLGANSNTLKKALTRAYPELNFGKFRTREYWDKLPNVRAFFDEFSRSSGFDPLVPENWYPITNRNVQQAGGGGILSAHNNVLKKALVYAYPDVKFDVEKFRTRVLSGHWSTEANVRAFFDEFARSHGFDPLVAGNWHHIKASSLHNAGGGGLLTIFSYDVQKALSFAYPELNFDNFKTRGKTKA